MDYLILLIVVAVLGGSAFYGYKKGLVRILLSTVALFVTVVVAAMLTVPVSAMLKAATPLDEGIAKSVSGLVDDHEVVSTESVSNLNLPGQIEKALVKGADAANDSFNSYIVNAVTDLLLKAITFFILIVIVYIVVKIIINILDFITRLPLINTFNKGGGLLVGLLQGLIFVWVGFLIITACANASWAQTALSQINGNVLLSFLYDNNLITTLMAMLI